MDININNDCDYYIKEEVRNDSYKKYNIFYINKDIQLNDKIIKEMKKYNIIEFGDKFNQPLCDNLPSGIKELIFGHQFNQPLCDNLPVSLEEITFGRFF